MSEASQVNGQTDLAAPLTIASVAQRRFRPRGALLWLILVLIMAVGVEVAAAAAVHFLLHSPAGNMLWDPDVELAHANWVAHAAAADDELGWPGPIAATRGDRDATGAKVNPDFPDAAKACMSAYGDSFIWGEQVPLRDGWIEQLSRRLGCRIANYGVSSYGTDQAYVRFQRMTQDHAPIVLLGIFPDNIARNLNQYRAFIGHAPEPHWLKGRFILDAAGQLQWIARPRLDADSFARLQQNPAAFVPHDYFLPDTTYGPISVRFPYTLVLARLAMSPRLWTRLHGATSWIDLYRPDHPSGAVPLTIEIVRAFLHEAERHGVRPFVVMLPGVPSFRTAERYGKPNYAPFLAAMAASGIDVFDTLSPLLTALHGQSFCMLYVDEGCAGHFSVAGNRFVADIVAAELKRRKLIN